MDPVTHAASGAIAMLACPNRPVTRWAVPLAALASASPDVDIFFAPSPLDFLLLHRGITHSLAALPFMGLLLALGMYPLWRRSTPGAWTFERTLLAAMGLVLLHIWLDCATTYGTMIFLPFSEYRVRLNGLFIVDFLYVVPMLATLYLWRERQRVVLGALLWVLLYPAACVGLRLLHQESAGQRLAEQATQELTVLPDAFAPFRWRVLYETDTPYPAPPETPATSRSVHQQGLDWLGNPITPVYDYPAANPALMTRLSKESRDARAFFSFTLLPLQYKKPWDDGTQYLFYDLRFATLVPLVQKIMQLRPNGEIPFQYLARLTPEGTLHSERMLFSGGNRESPWLTPQAPRPPTVLEWLVGLH